MVVSSSFPYIVKSPSLRCANEGLLFGLKNLLMELYLLSKIQNNLVCFIWLCLGSLEGLGDILKDQE
jgi:hypothetical protein